MTDIKTYTDEENETWALLFKKQSELLPGRACAEFFEGLAHLNFNPKRIPQLREVSKVLTQTTGWRVIRVDGLVPAKEFFEHLARKEFPSTDFIRQRKDIDYTPAPDLFHDIFGHLSLITNLNFAAFFQAMGQAGAKAEGPTLNEIQQLYWFTVEFGLIRKEIYGSGILSSPGEAVHALSDKVKVHKFDISKIVVQPYKTTEMQPEFFAIESFEQLKREFIQFGRSRNILS